MREFTESVEAPLRRRCWDAKCIAPNERSPRSGPPAGRHGPGSPGGPPGAEAIATYLGITAAQLRTDLQSGQSLADVAKAQGKTVSGLEDAIVADASSHLDATQLANLKSHLDDIVNRTGPPARP